VAALVVALAVFVLRATPFGRYVLAAGGNPAAARLEADERSGSTQMRERSMGIGGVGLARDPAGY